MKRILPRIMMLVLLGLAIFKTHEEWESLQKTNYTVELNPDNFKSEVFQAGGLNYILYQCTDKRKGTPYVVSILMSSQDISDIEKGNLISKPISYIDEFSKEKETKHIITIIWIWGLTAIILVVSYSLLRVTL